MPYLFHGAYNFLVPYGNYFYVVLLIMLVLAYKLHEDLKLSQKSKKKEPEKKTSFFS